MQEHLEVCDRERETGTGRLGKVEDTGNVLEEDDKANCFLQ